MDGWHAVCMLVTGFVIYELLKLARKYDELIASSKSKDETILKLVTANRGMAVRMMENVIESSDEEVTIFTTKFQPDVALMSGVIGDDQVQVPYSAVPTEYQDAVEAAYTTWRILKNSAN